jgi:Flp pilus assembly pilin Flp
MVRVRRSRHTGRGRRSSGATAVQYVLLLAGIAAVVVAAIVIFGGFLSGQASGM